MKTSFEPFVVAVVAAVCQEGPGTQSHCTFFYANCSLILYSTIVLILIDYKLVE